MHAIIPRRATPFRLALIGAAALLMSACSALRIGYETPRVNVQSIRMLPGTGGAALPTFEIGLQVLNPNAEALRLRGISYTISLNDQPLIKGVGNNLPVIAAYGEGSVKLTASINVLAGIGLFRDMLDTSGDSFRYEFEAKLDPGAYQPKIRVSDSGVISLNN